jgi:hypothetical protein
MKLSRCILLGMKHFLDKICKGNQNNNYVFKFFPENYVCYEVIWKNVVEPDRPHMAL